VGDIGAGIKKHVENIGCGLKVGKYE